MKQIRESNVRDLWKISSDLLIQDLFENKLLGFFRKFANVLSVAMGHLKDTYSACHAHVRTQ